MNFTYDTHSYDTHKLKTHKSIGIEVENQPKLCFSGKVEVDGICFIHPLIYK